MNAKLEPMVLELPAWSSIAVDCNPYRSVAKEGQSNEISPPKVAHLFNTPPAAYPLQEVGCSPSLLMRCVLRISTGLAVLLLFVLSWREAPIHGKSGKASPLPLFNKSFVTQLGNDIVSLSRPSLSRPRNTVQPVIDSQLSISADGSRVAVYTSFMETGPIQSKVQVFEWSANTYQWENMGRKGNIAWNSDSFFNIALSPDGSKLAISGQSQLDATDSTVQVYGWTGDEWAPIGDTLTQPYTFPHHCLQLSVALSFDGSRLVVGSACTEPLTNSTHSKDPNHTDTGLGMVRVFDLEVEQGDPQPRWKQVGSDILGDKIGGLFGHDVAISGNGSRIVGCAGNTAEYSEWDGGEYSEWDGGVARVLDWTGNQWQSYGSDILYSKPYDQFTTISVCLSLDGRRFALSPYHSYTGSFCHGHVRVYGYSDSDRQWMQVDADIDGDFDVTGSSVDDPEHMMQGGSLALSSDASRIAVGAISDFSDGKNRRVRVFDFVWGKWQQAVPDIDGDQGEVYFGNYLAMSSDGSRLATVLSREKNGNVSNIVRVFNVPTPFVGN